MKKLAPISLLAFLFIFIASCSKDKAPLIISDQLKTITIIPSVKGVTDWKHVFGGKAAFELRFKSNDSITASQIKDSIHLKTVETFKKSVVAGKYDISLKTGSNAIADTFLRFSAELKDYLITSDQALKMTGATTDGLITIAKSLVKPSTKPNFVQSGTTKIIDFGLANDAYFLYVKGSIEGKITFTEATTDDTFIKTITVTPITQHNLIPKLNSAKILVFSNTSFN